MSAVASSLQAIADPPRSTTRPRSTNSLHAIPPVESAAESAISDRRGGGRGGPNGGRRSGRTDGPRAAGLDGMELEETRQAKPQSGRRGKPSTGRPRANGSTARVDDGEPALSWSIEASVPSSTHHTESSLSSLSTPHQSQSPATSATDVSAPKAPRKRKPQKKRVFDGKQENGKESSAVDIKELDPTAKSFTPTLPHAGPSRSSSSGDLRDMKGREIPSTKNGSRPNGVLSRRAAFEKGSKLTSSGETGEVKVARTEKKEEKLADDLNSRLSRGLSRKPFLECPICFNAITPSQPTWSCLPPHGPPPTPAPTLDDPNPAPNPNHYTSCYTPFHLSCIRDWANRSLAEEAEKARNAGREGEELEWRCPGCQKRRSGGIGGYRCFCGRLNQPPTNTLAPHSCADSCIRKRVCGHDCVLNCHPGPCPPCNVALIVPCPSHHHPLQVRCSTATSNNAVLRGVCDEICSRSRGCGKREHQCEELCHHGPCKPCDEIEVVKCYCGQEEKTVACGWNLDQEKFCVQKSTEGDGEDALMKWQGRFSCENECERLFDCGIHPCKLKCHPHPIHPLPCPTSPDAITHCPCGATPLRLLPNYPRESCTSPVPTCASQCPKSRPCGHPCPKKCHEGECPPCKEEVVRPCRCGESMMVVPCEELMERLSSGLGEKCCERVCRALRSCGRHECGRLCCPLAYKAKPRTKRRMPDDPYQLDAEDDMHVCPLTCGKMLSCGMHTCQKKDHKGACGRCLDASYDELICHCGHTVIYPPVACGTTISCPYPCSRPPPLCGHPKTPHNCHESAVCPPCPYLTSKPCACGKDPSVKNVRCSQDRISCGQICGKVLSCGGHFCQSSCHKPGECESCKQVCGKPKRICKHACGNACHAPTKCPETDPCQSLVDQSCSCGHLKVRTSCGASTSNPSSRESVTLKCNSECILRQRNARLADALGIKVNDGTQRVGSGEDWTETLKAFAKDNHAFVKTVEATFRDFFMSTRQTMILPHMPASKRTFVISLADVYRLGRELIDQEPNRSVQIRRRIDTRIPNPLLSDVAGPAPPKPSLGGLTNLRSIPPKAWGAGASATTGASVANGTGGGSGSLAKMIAAGSRESSRPATPIAPVLAHSAPIASLPAPPASLPTASRARQVKRVPNTGQVDGENVDDWDQSGDEA